MDISYWLYDDGQHLFHCSQFEYLDGEYQGSVDNKFVSYESEEEILNAESICELNNLQDPFSGNAIFKQNLAQHWIDIERTTDSTLIKNENNQWHCFVSDNREGYPSRFREKVENPNLK